MPDYYPTPTASPFDDITEYVSLLLGVCEDWLDDPAQWEEGEYPTARGYIEDLKSYLMELPNMALTLIGEVKTYAGDTLPTGYLWCDGTIYDVDDYPALVAALHESYIVGDGTFYVPDMRDRYPAGWNGGGVGDDTGDIGGAATVTLSLSQVPAHSHDIATSVILAKQNGTAGTSNRLMRGTDANTNSNVTNQLTGTTVSQGGGGAHDNLPPFWKFRYIIRAQ